MKLIKKLMAWFRRIGAFLAPMQIRIHAAYTSFFLILSVFPLLVLLFGILGYTSFGLEEVMELVSQLLPEALMGAAEKIISGAYENTSAMVLSVSVLTAIWSASRSILGLMEGLNAVYGLTENRKYLQTRGISAIYTVLFLAVLVLTLVLYVFGTMILDFLRMTTNPLLMVLMDLFDMRTLLLMVLQVLLFTAMYAALPNRRHSLMQSLPGALLASLGWIGFSKLFSLYVVYFPNYANIYGSVYAAALAMLWLYCCISIVFYGGALNRFLMEYKVNSR